MKRFVLCISIMMIFSDCFSQKLFFVYIQAEPEQAFFLKLNDKMHSSSSSGYLILSRLHDSTYTIAIGFPQNKWPEQKFNIDIKGKDKGYSLKNFGEKGWGLYDFENMSVQMASADNSSKTKTISNEGSVFTDILSKAANDPTLKEKQIDIQPAVAKESNKSLQEQAIVKKEQPIEKKDDQQTMGKEEPMVKKEEISNGDVELPYKRSVIMKKLENAVSEGLSLTFVDDYGNAKKDTIHIIIPDIRSKTSITKEPKEEKKFLNISVVDTTKEKMSVQELSKSKVTKAPKSNCIAVASESDFLKLRKKMAAELKDEAMVDEAKKYYKMKCFTVAQVKNISTMFLNDAGKYKFFDASYEHVSDPENFASLVAEMKDEYYINRFKAMLR